MLFGTRPLFIVVLALAAAPLAPAPVQAQQPALSDSEASPLVDSLRADLARFKGASPPTAADSAALRRWTDSVQAQGSLRLRPEPVQARRFLRKALRAARLLSDSIRTASTLNDVGKTYYFQSQYERALDHYRESLEIRQAIGDRRGIVVVLKDIGLVYENRGQYEKALGQYRTSLEIGQEIGYREGIATVRNSIGIVYKSQGRYEEALAQYHKSLEIYREIGDRNNIAITLNNIANIYENQGRYEEALSPYRTSLEISRELGNRWGVATALNNTALLYSRQSRDSLALTQFQEALDIFREIGSRLGIAAATNGLGLVHKNRGQYEAALRYYRQSLHLNREIGQRANAALDFRKIGEVHLQRGDLAAATDTLEEAVRLAETLRQNATSPEARRSLLSTQIDAYRALTTAHIRARRPDSALRALERARARLLADRLAGTVQGDTTFTSPSVAELRRALDSDTAALLYANAGSEWPLTALVVTPDSAYARELPDSTVRATVKRTYTDQLERLRRTEGPLTAALGSSTDPSPDELPSLAETVRLYRSYLVRSETATAPQNDLARRFHGLLVEPVEEVLGERDDLVVVPTGALGYLPFETLRDSTGRYLLEKAHVRYAQSLTVLRQLQARDYPTPERPLLAFGGAAYASRRTDDGSALVAETDDASTSVASEGQASAFLRSAKRRLERGKSPRLAYAQLGYTRWVDLPGTKAEAGRLGAVAGTNATILTGSEASEPTLRTLSTKGDLADYRRVHFATHGIAVPEVPELSALVLSQVGASDSLAAEDGYLTMEEIASLELQADVAVLSACQTGLGRIVAGEGVVSLSHAFLRAGANATLVSQWKVLDESTQQFMTAVYERAKADDTSFAEAVTETKQAFINGEYGEKNTDPLRWAPFVYYGRE